MCGGYGIQLRAVRGHERLVRGNDRGASSQEPSDECSRRFNGIERVNHHVVAAAKEGRVVIREARGFWATAWLARISNQGMIDLKANAGRRGSTAIGGQPRNGLANLTQSQ